MLHQCPIEFLLSKKQFILLEKTGTEIELGVCSSNLLLVFTIQRKEYTASQIFEMCIDRLDVLHCPELIHQFLMNEKDYRIN